jgi:hypothetical protein
MSAAGLHKWSGIDQSQSGRDASQDNFQDYGPGPILPAVASLHKISNHTNNSGCSSPSQIRSKIAHSWQM